MSSQHFRSPSSTKRIIIMMMVVVLTNQLLGCGATYSIFISNSQLESYFQGTEEFSLIKDLQVDIIRDGKSLVLEDGSLQLIEDDVVSSGSGQAPPPTEEGPTEMERRRRASSSFLSPMDTTLPTLPAQVDQLVFTWHASTSVSYQLLLGDCPSNHFEELSSSIPESGFIPLETQDFSILFPCDSSALGTGQLLVNLTTTVVGTGEELVTNFMLEKNCQGEPPTTLLPTPSTSQLPMSTPLLSPSLADATPSTSVPMSSPTPALETSLAPTPSISEDDLPLMPFTSLLVEPTTTTVLMTPTPSAVLLTSLVPSSSPLPPPVSPPPVGVVTSTVNLEVVSETSTLLQPSVTPPPPIPPTVKGTQEPEDNSQFIQLLIIVFAPVASVLIISICILFCSVCICFCCCRKKKRQYNDDPSELPVNMMLRDDYLYPPTFELEEKKDETPISLWMALAWGSVCNLPSGIQGVIKRYSMDRRSLNILATVSRGDTGCIVNGQLSTDTTDPIAGNKGVMMKMYIGFQKQNGHCDEITKFLELATLLRGIDHPNIHTFMSVSVEDNYVPIVAYPIMEYGNLQQFLALCRVTPADSPLNPATLQHKISFVYQIACGMNHLCEKSLIHPDLALRNCYLDTNYQVKISESALSQCFYPDCYHQVRGTVRPVRWAAIETLQEGLCTSQSNVWSYGVTMWEVMTLARLPYFEVDHNRNVLTHLLMQNRLAQPNDCPDNIYTIMQDCWKGRAEDRPKFDTIHSALHDIHNQSAALQSAAPPTQAPEGISYSTFGKDLRSHDAPPLETASVSLRNSFHRRLKSGGSLRGSMSRGSPANSQRNSVNLLNVDSQSGTGERLSITFSVLSIENDLDPSSESEAEEPKGGLSFEIPPFLTGAGQEESKKDPVRTEMDRRRAESPMDMVSTFLAGSRPARTSLDNVDYSTSTFLPPTTSAQPSPPVISAQPSPPVSSVQPPPPVISAQPSPPVSSVQPPSPIKSAQPSPRTPNRPAPLPPTVATTSTPQPSPHTPTRPAPPPPTAATPQPSPHTPSRPAPPPPTGTGMPPAPGGSVNVKRLSPLVANGTSNNNNNNRTPDIIAPPPPAVSITPSNQDTPSLPDSPMPRYSSGPRPSSHIPGLPASTYNKTSVSIDDVKLRNKPFLDANTHATKSASLVSTTTSGASKSDSGIRSDEEVESVFSNGASSSEARTPVSNKASVDSMGKKDSEISLGISDLSSDLMATFATWGKD